MFEFRRVRVVRRAAPRPDLTAKKQEALWFTLLAFLGLVVAVVWVLVGP